MLHIRKRNDHQCKSQRAKEAYFAITSFGDILQPNRFDIREQDIKREGEDDNHKQQCPKRVIAQIQKNISDEVQNDAGFDECEIELKKSHNDDGNEKSDKRDSRYNDTRLNRTETIIPNKFWEIDQKYP